MWLRISCYSVRLAICLVDVVVCFHRNISLVSCIDSFPSSTLSFLVAFMYTCFSSSSSVTSVLGGVALLVVGVFAVLCIRTGSIADSNKPYPQCPLRDNLGPRDSGRGMPVDIMYKVKVQDEVASPAEDKKEGRTRQQIWPLSLFRHKSRSAPPIQADNGDRVKVEV